MNIVPSDREPVRKGKRSCGALRGSLAEHFLGQGHDLQIFVIFPVSFRKVQDILHLIY